jgi:GGDEF domain-containing protein
MLARLGGDEFVIVIEGDSSKAALELQVEKLRSAISKPISRDKSRIDATTSVGIAGYTDDSNCFSDVMR